jgi:signal transduction histidine kinase/DNA-binding LacI/PurR family transcriptional regulator/AraC-like DNA-binding protein/DNA-binding response OmpR family regulator
MGHSMNKPAKQANAQSGRSGGDRHRPTLGFLSANIHIGTGRSLWPAIVRAAQRRDANLICFPGGGLRASGGFESQRNAIYDLANPGSVDGLISWSSTLGRVLEPAVVADFHNRFHPLPMISLAQLMADVPTVLVDSYNGMRAVLVHLIEVHGYRRLAFIRGPERHFYAQERFRAYTETLKAYGIHYNDTLVTPPLPWEAGAEAVRILLDENQLRPRIDFQAILAVSDLLALDALKALQGRGIEVPGDVALSGFNDSTESRLSTPPLTSVSLPFAEQGERAVEMALAQLGGESVPGQVLLPSRLVIRQSCGCPSAAVVQAAARPAALEGLDFPMAMAAFRDRALAEMEEALPDAGEESSAWARSLLEAFQAELQAAPAGCFIPTLEKVLGRAVAGGTDPAAGQGLISALRRRALPYLGQPARSFAEDLFSQARVVIGETAQRVQIFLQWQAERQTALLQEIGQALITTFDIAKLADVLAASLPRLGITSGYLALYEQPALSLEYSRLILAYDEKGRAPVEIGGRRFLSRRLLPEGTLPSGRRISLVVEPLYFQDAQIGFALFEIGPLDGSIYETLRGHISSALKGALLFQEAQQARLAAEKADQIKTRLLANVSHELRTPLNIILGHTRNAMDASQSSPRDAARDVSEELQHIQNSAEHQLRVINDLLDLSRAEVDELDLHPELLEPLPLLMEVYESMSGRADNIPDVKWDLRVPDHLPLIQADPVRLRQIFLNLLSNARKYTGRGTITLGAETAPPFLHLWVADTGIGIPEDQQEHIFEPFGTGEHTGDAPPGIGLGLSITRHLVALHGGSIKLDSRSGKGSTFHVFLPLPRIGGPPSPAAEDAQPALLLISSSEEPADEIVELSRRQGLEIRRLQAGGDWDKELAGIRPAALAWDLADAKTNEWTMVRRFRAHPLLSQAPVILYGQVTREKGSRTGLTLGLTSFLDKSAGPQGLLESIHAARLGPESGPMLIVDDDPDVLKAHRETVQKGLPGLSIRTAESGEAALQAMREDIPSLVILDLIMPGMGGEEVLDWMRADPRLRTVPVVILSSKLLNLEDVKRLERYARVTFQSKGILTAGETIAALNRALFGADTLPPQTSALVKRTIAFLHQNYSRPLSRWELAKALGISEDYLSRVFNRELGLSPWDYLNRYRILQAKTLLQTTSNSMRIIARQVGFRDQSYFSRVFHKFTGRSPQAFREHPEG